MLNEADDFWLFIRAITLARYLQFPAWYSQNNEGSRVRSFHPGMRLLFWFVCRKTSKRNAELGMKTADDSADISKQRMRLFSTSFSGRQYLSLLWLVRYFTE